MSSLQVNIVSAEASIHSGTASMVVATACYGEIGIKSKHAPLLASLKPGQVRLVQDGEEDEQVFYISGGYIEVQPDVVTILADTAARAQDLDEAAAMEAEKRAREELQDKQANLDYANALIQLAQASAQLDALRRLRKERK